MHPKGKETGANPRARGPAKTVRCAVLEMISQSALQLFQLALFEPLAQAPSQKHFAYFLPAGRQGFAIEKVGRRRRNSQ